MQNWSNVLLKFTISRWFAQFMNYICTLYMYFSANLLLDVLECSIAVYFYSLFQLIKIYSDTTHQNV